MIVALVGPTGAARLVSTEHGEFIVDGHGVIWSVAGLAEAAHLWASASVFDGHGRNYGQRAPAADVAAKVRPAKGGRYIAYFAGYKMRVGAHVRVGRIVSSWWDAEAREIQAELEPTTYWAETLPYWRQEYPRGGFSVVLREWIAQNARGRHFVWKIRQPFGVDLVDVPACGGRFID